MAVRFGGYHDRDILQTKGSGQLSKWQKRRNQRDALAVSEKPSLAGDNVILLPENSENRQGKIIRNNRHDSKKARFFDLPHHIGIQCLRSPEAVAKMSQTSRAGRTYHTKEMYIDAIRIQQKDEMERPSTFYGESYRFDRTLLSITNKLKLHVSDELKKRMIEENLIPNHVSIQLPSSDRESGCIIELQDDDDLENLKSEKLTQEDQNRAVLKYSPGLSFENSTILQAYVHSAHKGLVPDETYLHDSLIKMAPYVSGDLRQNALEKVTELNDDWKRSRALVAYIKPDMSLTDLNFFLESAKTIKNQVAKGSLLQELAKNVKSSKDLKPIFEQAKNLSKSLALRHFFCQLIQNEDKEVRTKCVEIIKSKEDVIGDEYLSRILRHFSLLSDKNERGEILGFVDRMQSETYKAMTLSVLVPEADSQELDGIRERVSTMNDPISKKIVLDEIAYKALCDDIIAGKGEARKNALKLLPDEAIDKRWNKNIWNQSDVAHLLLDKASDEELETIGQISLEINDRNEDYGGPLLQAIEDKLAGKLNNTNRHRHPISIVTF